MDEIEARLNRLRSPLRTAEPFWVAVVIDPRDTQQLQCEFANMAAPLRAVGESRFTMRPWRWTARTVCARFVLVTTPIASLHCSAQRAT